MCSHKTISNLKKITFYNPCDVSTYIFKNVRELAFTCICLAPDKTTTAVGTTTKTPGMYEI